MKSSEASNPDQLRRRSTAVEESVVSLPASVKISTDTSDVVSNILKRPTAEVRLIQLHSRMYHLRHFLVLQLH